MVRSGSDPLVLLDACCLINLLVTGRAEEILAGLPYRCSTSRMVAVEEVLSIAEAGGAVRLDQFDHLLLIDLTSDEEWADFLRFSTELDRGEASLCSLAVHYQAIVATDDRRALRALRRETLQVPTLQTTDLFYEWARLAKLPDREIIAALKAVQTRARYSPRRDAPRYEWWASFSR